MKKQPRQRAKKGSVALFARDGMLRLRFSFAGQRIDRALGLADSPDNRTAATGITKQIEADIARDRFSLEALPNYLPKTQAKPTPTKPTTAQLFEQFTEHRRAVGTGGYRLATRYKAIHAHLVRWGQDITSPDDARIFITSALAPNQSPATLNSNQQILKAFGRWATDQSFLALNPFDNLPTHRGPGRDRSKRKPFSADEVTRILQVTYQHHPHWYDYILTLLTFGLRPSEAIGLRWEDIDPDHKTLTIATTLARSENGRTVRVRKPPKTGDLGIRTLSIPDEVLDRLLSRRTATTTPDQLVFTSPQGKPIDDHNFAQRTWRQILKAAKVDYRPPYTCRHTTASQLLEDGATLPQTAQVLGHKDTTMLAKVYAHALTPPTLPRYHTPDLHQFTNPAPK